MKTVLCAVAALFLPAVLACAGDGRRHVTGEDLAGYRFVLTQVNGEKPPGVIEVFFQVDPDMSVFGQVCNTFRGQMEVSGDRIRVPAPMSTRMACPDEDLGRLEGRLLRVLENGMMAGMEGDRLILRRDDMVLVFFRSLIGSGEPERLTPIESADTERLTESGTVMPPRPAGTVSQESLMGRAFLLESMNGRDFLTEDGGEPPFIEFSEDFRVHGRACNTFNGQGVLTDGTLTVERAAVTMMFCINSDRNELERSLLNILRDGAAVSLSGGTLVLSGGDHRFVYREQE